MPNGTFSLVAQSQYYHAKEGCYICTKPDHLVDTAVQIEGEGVLALCYNCIKELGEEANVLDEVAENEIAEVAAINTRLAEQVDVEKRLVRKLRNQLRDLKDLTNRG